MDTTEWPRVKALFYEALDRPEEQRPAFLEAACRDDAALRQIVESLLASDEAAKSFMETRSPRELPALAVGPARRSSAQSLEVQTLLRQRLRVFVLVPLLALSMFNGFRFARHEMTLEIVLRSMVPAAIMILILAVLAVVLWRKRTYTLAALRVFEAVLFGILAVYFIGETYNPLFVNPGWLVTYVQRHPSEMAILARQPSIFWLALIIGYGTFIPNTGRRCAVVTSLLAVAPLTTVAVAGRLSTGIPPRLLVLFLSEMAMWMAVAVAFAIYGSHKITALREEALAARKLGQYQLKQRLGHGGMGEVYLAEHTLLRRPCAVKVIRTEQAGDPGTLQRFLREVQATATLTHPNTIQVFDYGQADDGTVFYAMEYLTGLGLDALVERDGPLPAARAIFVIRQLCGALAEAHAIGLIHRDIKPSNVILCNRSGLYDVAKLLDFGLVLMQSSDEPASRLTQRGFLFGTPAYMSPEQAAGSTDLDGRSDIYSLGALAYFLLTGQPPFVRETVAQTLAAHIDAPVATLRSRAAAVPQDLEAVVMQCLAKDRRERFADMASLDGALAGCRSAGEWTQSDAATVATPDRRA